jgi:LPS-assembly lipoprotein
MNLTIYSNRFLIIASWFQLTINGLLIVVLITGLGLLNACGFHLRGTEKFHFTSAQIQSAAADRLSQELERLLVEQEIKIIPTANEAQVIISLSKEKFNNRVLTVSAVSGKMAEVELTLQVELEVHQPNGTVLLEPQPLTLWRDYSFDETAVLAREAEEEILREEMFQDLIAQIMRRLQTIQVSSQDETTKP